MVVLKVTHSAPPKELGGIELGGKRYAGSSLLWYLNIISAVNVAYFGYICWQGG